MRLTNLEDHKKACALISAITLSGFMQGETSKTYVHSKHLKLLADIRAALQAKYIEFEDSGGTYYFEATFFEEKPVRVFSNGPGKDNEMEFYKAIRQDFETLIKILIQKKVESVVQIEGGGTISIVRAMQDLMSLLYADYKDYKFDSESKEEAFGEADFLMYVTKDGQLGFTFKNKEARDALLGKIGREWKFSEYYANKPINKLVKPSNQNLVQPAKFSNNDTTFFLTLYAAKNGEPSISCGDDNEKNQQERDESLERRDRLLREMGFIQDPAQPDWWTSADPRLWISWCGGLFYTDKGQSGIFFNKAAEIFKDTTSYLSFSKGIVTQLKRITGVKLIEKHQKLASEESRRLISHYNTQQEPKEESELKEDKGLVFSNSSNSSSFSYSSSSSNLVSSNFSSFVNNLNGEIKSRPAENKSNSPLYLEAEFSANGVLIQFSNTETRDMVWQMLGEQPQKALRKALLFYCRVLSAKRIHPLFNTF